MFSELTNNFNGDKNQLDELFIFYQNPYIENLLTELNRQNHFDILYERYSLFSVAGINFARAHKMPFVLEVNAPLITEASRYRHLYNQDLAQAIEKYLFDNSDHIIPVSNELRDYILTTTPEANVTTIPNGVSIERFENIAQTENINEYLKNYSSSDFNIGFVGSVRPWHGIDILLDSFAELVCDKKDSKLIIIGDRSRLKSHLDDQCEALGINELVVFTGAVPHDDIPALMQKTDVLVAPYPEMKDFYFSALKVFEYMAAGKPIVASRIGQIATILKHEKTALLVPPGDRPALCDALLRIKNNPDLGHKLGENARVEAFEKHSWKQRIAKTSSIFKTLMGR